MESVANEDGTPIKVQGEAGMCSYLRANPAVYEKIETTIRKLVFV
jgi:hypothetical protein